MYLLLMTLKTASGIFAVAVLLYTIVIAFVCPKLKSKGKKAAFDCRSRPFSDIWYVCILHFLLSLRARADAARNSSARQEESAFGNQVGLYGIGCCCRKRCFPV